MKVGSLVELVDDRWDASQIIEGELYPIKGRIYTIRTFNKTHMGLKLDEIRNPKFSYERGVCECSFNITRFRELLPPMEISIESILEKELINQP